MSDLMLVFPSYPYPRKSPPLGVAYLAASARDAGMSVRIVDMGAEGISHEELRDRMAADRPRLVGISFMTSQFGGARAVAVVAKEVEAATPVLVGGPHVSALPEETLADVPEFDIAVYGEGEATVLEVADRLLGDAVEGALGVQGSAFRQGGSIVVNPPRPSCEDLDALPFPAWDLLPLDCYSVKGLDGRTSDQPVFPILTSRGCPSYCVFCSSHSVFGRAFHGRSAENIFSELLHLRNEYGARMFDFVDDTITIRRDRILRLCELLREEAFLWACNARVNTVDLELFRAMKEAGCVRVDLGVESGDPEVLKRVKKRITLDQVRNAHSWAKEAGIEVCSFYMVNNLGEGWSSVEQTLALARELDSDDPGVTIATPYPGTELYEICRENGWLKVWDWDRYVTIPHSLADYEVVATNGVLTEAEAIRAYYLLNSEFVRKKLVKKYGKYFYLHPGFFRAEVLGAGGVKAGMRRIRAGLRLVLGFVRARVRPVGKGSS